MKFSEHGAVTDEIYQQFHIEKPDRIIDFSTNTNVVENPIEKDVKSLLNELDLSIYPDLEAKELVSVVANINNLQTDEILVTNGSNEAIYLLASYMSGEKVGIVDPTYPEYKKAVEAYGGKVCSISFPMEQSFFDINKILENIEESKYRYLFICNPNNPTGEMLCKDTMEHLIQATKKANVVLILDEAYIDFIYENKDIVCDRYDTSFFDENPHVIVLRSLTKIYQLAGVRLGLVFGNPKWIKRLKNRQPSWSVNTLAQRIGKYYLQGPKEMKDLEVIKDKQILEADYILKTQSYYHHIYKELVPKMKEIGFSICPTKVNFYLLPCEDDLDLISYLLTKGIIIRHTRNHIGLDGRYVRIAIRTPQDNKYLLKVLKGYKEMELR